MEGKIDKIESIDKIRHPESLYRVPDPSASDSSDSDLVDFSIWSILNEKVAKLEERLDELEMDSISIMESIDKIGKGQGNQENATNNSTTSFWDRKVKPLLSGIWSYMGSPDGIGLGIFLGLSSIFGAYILIHHLPTMQAGL